MLIDKNIAIHLSCQQFECDEIEITEEKSVLRFRSSRNSSDEVCPYCGGRVHVYDNAKTTLKDMPIWFGIPLLLEVEHHRYRCTCCGRSFSEEVCMRYLGAQLVPGADLKQDLDGQA